MNNKQNSTVLNEAEGRLKKHKGLRTLCNYQRDPQMDWIRHILSVI